MIVFAAAESPESTKGGVTVTPSASLPANAPRTSTMQSTAGYYQRDPQGALLKQPSGLPVANPIIDRCSDDDQFQLAEAGIVMRFRERKGAPVPDSGLPQEAS